MKTEHGEISILLESFDMLNNIDFDKSKEAFSVFEKEVIKHFDIEEKSIFVLNSLIMDDEISKVFDLMTQHGAIMGIISQIKQNIENNSKSDITILREMLNNHANFEETEFYPRLDEKLSVQDKENIIKKFFS